MPSYPPSTLDDIRASGPFAERDCGTCSTFTYALIAGILAQRCRRVFGCNLDAAVVTEARRRHHPDNASFEVQDGCGLTYAAGSFSTIVNSNTLEHVTDDEAMLRSFQPTGSTA